MNILFIMYPWDRITAESDSTLRIIHECYHRGHTVVVSTASNLTMRNSVASVFGNALKKNRVLQKSTSVVSFYKKAEFKRSNFPLAGFDCIIMRSEPPLDAIALNFLDSVRNDVFIMNDIDGLRIANNKLYTASFDDPENNFIPKTHVSKNIEYLEEVLKDSKTDKMIMKPLNGFGGAGVILIEKHAQQSFHSLLEFYIQSGNSKNGNYVILQDYIEGANDGDVRILMLNGEPIGAMKRVPPKGEVRSNIHAGGTAVKHTLTKAEKSLCRHIGPKLVRDGLFFVGIDVIGGKLVEVNVMSPGGIARINKLNRVKLQRNVVDFIEGVVSAKEAFTIRKTEFKKVIEDAIVV